jgi:type I restriction enzyme S subunit
MRDDWTTYSLKQLFTIVPGRYVPKSDYVENGPFWIYGSNSVMGTYSKALIDEPHIVMAAVGAYAGAVRYSAEPSWVNNNAFGIVPNAKVAPYFLYLWLAYVLELNQILAGTGQPYVRRPALAGQLISLPPIVEQRRIVDLVSSVDAYIESLQQQVDAARTARNAVLHDLLSAGGDDWTETPLGDVLEIVRGGSPRPIDAFLTNDARGVNWIKIGDASASSKYIYTTGQKIRQEGVSRSRLVKEGDFILSNSMSFGRPYIMRTTGCIHDGWLLLSNIHVTFDEDYLYNVLLSQDVQSQFESLAAGSGVRNLNIDVVKKVRVPVPPRAHQEWIASTANGFDEYVRAAEDALEEARGLRSGLLADLLSGEHEIPASYDRFMGAA